MKVIKYLLIFVLIYALSMGGLWLFDNRSATVPTQLTSLTNALGPFSKDLTYKLQRLAFSFRTKQLKPPTEEWTKDGISGQFIQGSEVYVYTAYDDVQVFAQANELSFVMQPLLPGERVRIFYEDKTPVTYMGHDTHWVYIGSPNGEQEYGWALAFQFAFPTQFVPVTTWTWDTFAFCKGDYCAEYSVNFNGQYENHWSAEGGEIFLEGKEYGQFSQYGMLRWANDKTEDMIQDVFVMTEDGGLKQEARYKANPVKQLN